MSLFLHAENHSSLGDDTIWLWLHREFGGRFDWENATKDDVVIQYSALGPYEGPAKYIAACWEMYPEMQRTIPHLGDWAAKAQKCLDCANGTPWRTVPTEATAYLYDNPAILPITVDTDVFRPLNNKRELRDRYGFEQGATYGFWCGTRHPMKGYDLLIDYATKNPSVLWVVAWKDAPVPQVTLNELMNCADFVLSTGRLKPLFLVEWEALAAGLPLVNADGVERELPGGTTSLEVFRRKWDRASAKQLWADYLAEVEAA